MRIAIAAAAAAALTPSAASADPRPLTHAEASDLVTRYLSSRGATRLTGFWLDDIPMEPYPGFYSFSANWANPRGASVVIGHYSVDRRTGDIWSAVICEEERSRTLRLAQGELRARIGMNRAVYLRVRRAGPMC